MISKDVFSELNLNVFQPEKGYRYNEDSVTLANFIEKIKKNATVVDLGAGCGIISLLLARKFDDIKVVAVEVEPSLFDFLKKNIQLNQLDNRVIPILSDWRDLKKQYNNCVDVVVTNPPFREPDSGRISSTAEKAVARHELRGGLEGLIDTARVMLKDKGVFYSVFLSERLVDLITLMRQKHIEPKEILPVYPNHNKSSTVFLVKGVKNAGRSTKLLPPFFRR